MASGATPRFFFVHVMKTGGTSFVLQMATNFAPAEVYPSEALDRRAPTDVEPYASVDDLERLTPQRRAEIRVFTGHLPLVARELIGPDVVTLTLLRDPVARAVSVLKHFKRLYARYRDLPLDAIYDDDIVFPHFVQDFQTRVFALEPADHPRAFAGTADYRSLRFALEAPPGSHAAITPPVTIDAARLARAKQNLDSVDVVGVNEEFAAFVAELRQRFGWWGDGADYDARANVSSEPWVASDALRARIARESANDQALYEHARQLIATRRRVPQ
jgi:hypothetical protein